MNFGLESSVLSLRCKYTSSIIGSRGKEKSSPGKNLDFMSSSGIESQPESAANGYAADRPDNDPENSISLKRSSKAVGQTFRPQEDAVCQSQGLGGNDWRNYEMRRVRCSVLHCAGVNCKWSKYFRHIYDPLCRARVQDRELHGVRA